MSNSNRHALIYWVEEQTFSVTSEIFVMDKRCLDDQDLVGLVKYADSKRKEPKDGWPSFPGKVRAVSDNWDEIVKREIQLNEELMRDCIATNVKTKGKRTLEGAEASCSKAKKPEGELKVKKSRQIHEQRNDKKQYQMSKKATFKTDSDACTIVEGNAVQKYSVLLIQKDEEILALQKEVARLKEENAEIFVLRKLNIQLQGGLIQKMNAVVHSTKNTKVFSPTPASSSHPSPSQSALTTVSSQPTEPIVPIQNASPTSELSIYSFMDKNSAMMCNRDGDYRKLICNLMIALFSTDELVSSSVTGRVQTGEPLRTALQPSKVAAIIEYVQMAWPSVERTAINAKMAQKLKDDRKRHETSKKLRDSAV